MTLCTFKKINHADLVKKSEIGSLKNREFDKEGPHNFRSERASSEERKGASENKNSAVNLTQSKTDSSSCLGIFQR